MSQIVRALVAFLLAPAFPGALLYLCCFFWRGYDAELGLGLLRLGFIGYAANFFLGAPLYFFLHRRGIRSPSAYGLLGALVGPASYLIFELMSFPSGMVLVTLRHSYGFAIAAAVYSSLVALAFWVVAYWPRTKSVTP